MPTMRIVPTLDEIKHFPARFGWRMEGVAIDQLTLKRGEETLAQRVVEAITDGTHRWTHTDPVRSVLGTIIATALPEGERCVLAPSQPSRLD